jgi:lipid-A-disaccharide synthase
MRVFLIAGEPSGDRLGAALMSGLKSLVPDVSFEGVGGQAMQSQGLQSVFPMSELSIMGLVEVLPKYFHLKRRIKLLADQILAEKPDVVVTIDSPDFCLRVAKLVKAHSNIRIVHYVAPSVWAWRPRRAAKMVGLVDQVLALLPFEPRYMENVGIRCDFVGHPVAAEPVASAASLAAFSTRHRQGKGPLILLLPGSRKSEVTRLMPVIADVVGRITALHGDVRFVLPCAQGVEDLVRQSVRDWANVPILLASDSPDKAVAFAGCDVALAASGTVSLELAAARTPMVIAYDMSWLSWQIMSRKLLVDTVTLVNLVAESRTIPDFLGPNCRAKPIADALELLLTDQMARDAQLKAMDMTMHLLGQGQADLSLKPARAILDGLQDEP